MSSAGHFRQPALSLNIATQLKLHNQCVRQYAGCDSVGIGTATSQSARPSIIYTQVNAAGGSRAEIARAHALSGSEGEVRKILSEMLERSEVANAPFGIALVYISLGDKASALDWLNRAYEGRVYPLPEIARDPRFDPCDLRSASKTCSCELD